jgi:hypothetical protein
MQLSLVISRVKSPDISDCLSSVSVTEAVYCGDRGSPRML